MNQRQRYDAAVARKISGGLNPKEEAQEEENGKAAMANSLSVEPMGRTVSRSRSRLKNDSVNQQLMAEQLNIPVLMREKR